MQTFTADQLNLRAEFNKFLLSNEKVFVIDGRPGCGKTFIIPTLIEDANSIKSFLTSLTGLDNSIQVVLTATTNKAVDALAEKIPDDVKLHAPISTIQSFLNLIVKEDYKTGKTFLKKTNNYVVHSNVLLFIDEGSMIDMNLLSEIDKATYNCKVVYILDKNQVLPVFEQEIPLLKKYPINVTLKDIVRQGNNSIKDLSNTYTDIVHNSALMVDPVHDGQHIFMCNPQEFKQAIDAEFSKPILDDSSHIICWSNNQVIAYNKYVRTLRGLTDLVTVGESLICNDAYTDSSGTPIFRNQEKVTVLEVSGEIVDPVTAIRYQEIKVRSKFNTAWVYKAVDPKHLNDWSKYYYKMKMYHEYFELKKKFCDLRDKYASTVHKSQGSTYEKAFVDLDNICTNNKIEEVRRLALVAFSRPTTQLFIRGTVPNKFKA